MSQPTTVKEKFLFGLVANRPAAGNPGWEYYATDEGVRYLDSGTDWVATQTSGSGAVPQFVQQTQPTVTGAWVWWQTDNDGNVIDLTVNI